MRRYSAAPGGQWQRPGLGQRLGVLGLTILIELALLLLVIAFGGSRIRERVAQAAATSVVFIDSPAEPAARPLQRQRAMTAAEPPPVTVSRAPAPRIVLPTVRQPLPYVPLSKADLDKGDIARLGTAGGKSALADSGESAVAEGPGEGPGGVRLHNAEWVVEPTDVQLRAFLPANVEPGSWALIACQTIAHNQVENCAQMGEQPRGSGLARAMRLAAWQFRVRPPRVNGKPQVGAWVRIRIEFGKDSSAD